MRWNIESLEGGCTPCVAIILWQMIDASKHLFGSPSPMSDLRIIHFLWALYWMKHYPTEATACAIMGGCSKVIDPKTMRKYVWFVIYALASLEEVVVSTFQLLMLYRIRMRLTSHVATFIHNRLGLTSALRTAMAPLFATAKPTLMLTAQTAQFQSMAETIIRTRPSTLLYAMKLPLPSEPIGSAGSMVHSQLVNTLMSQSSVLHWSLNLRRMKPSRQMVVTSMKWPMLALLDYHWS